MTHRLFESADYNSGLTDGANAALGATTDAESLGNGSVIAILKRQRTLLGTLITLLAAGLPAALVAGALATNISSVGGTAVTLGSKTSANSIPMVVASDQGAVAGNITQVGTAAVTLGSKTSANSIPVVVASDQAGVPGTVGGLTAVPTTANILAGHQAFTATTAATTIITITANKTWIGYIACAVDTATVGAGTAVGQALCVITTAGTNVTPAAGTYLTCEARTGANVAGGTVGVGAANYCFTPFIVNAPAGNTVTIQVTSTQAGTNSRVSATAVGVMN